MDDSYTLYYTWKWCNTCSQNSRRILFHIFPLLTLCQQLKQHIYNKTKSIWMSLVQLLSHWIKIQILYSHQVLWYMSFEMWDLENNSELRILLYLTRKVAVIYNQDNFAVGFSSSHVSMSWSPALLKAFIQQQLSTTAVVNSLRPGLKLQQLLQ